MADIRDRIKSDFTYHPPKEGQPAIYEGIRTKGLEMATHVVDNTPPSREQSLALTAIEEAVFWANAAIARNS